MSSWTGKVVGVLLLIILNIDATAQINSPFSRYGLGDINLSQYSTQRAMGNLGAALSSYNYINPVNPAAYGGFYQEEYTPYLKVIRRDSLATDPVTGKQKTVYYRDSIYRDTLTYVYKATTFSTGVDGTILTTRDPSQSVRTGDGSLSHLAMGFPIPKFGGISIGLMPYTSINYNVNSTSTFDSLLMTQQYRGDGGIRQVYAGIAGHYKGFYLGANFRYLFGTLTTSSINYFNDLPNSLGVRNTVRNTVSGYYAEVGAQYEVPITDDILLRLGAVGSWPGRVNARTDTINERILVNAGGQIGVIEADTLAVDAPRPIELPLTYSGGVVLEKTGHWLIGIDYAAEQWGDIRGFLADRPQNNSYRWAVGGQFVPKPGGSFLQRTKIRVGGYWGQTPLIINNKGVQDFGMTFGLGIPIIRSREKLHSSMDLAIQIGRLGQVQANGFEENYVRITLGLNLNDNKWIFKSKFY